MADDLLEGLVKQFRLSDEEFWALTETEEGCERPAFRRSEKRRLSI